MKTKVCFKCEIEKPLTEFYKHSEMGDGHLNKCITCAKNDINAERKNNPAKHAERERKRNTTSVRKAQRKAYYERYKAKYPEKVIARRKVAIALRDGKMLRQPCEVCGKKANAHHDDYSKPLEVRWLCVKDHHILHNSEKGLDL